MQKVVVWRMEWSHWVLKEEQMGVVLWACDPKNTGRPK